MVPIDILQLVDYLEKITSDAMRLPGGKVMLNQAELLNLVEQMRLAVPVEIRQAREVLAERQRMLGQAMDESSSIVRQAQNRAAQHLDDHALVKQAEQQARVILDEASSEANSIINGADDYAEESLRQLSQSIAQLNAVIQNGLHALASRRSKRSQRAAAGTAAADRPKAVGTSEQDPETASADQRIPLSR